MVELNKRYEGVIDSIHSNGRSFQIWVNELNKNILGLPRNFNFKYFDERYYIDYIVGNHVSFEIEPNPKRIGGFIAKKIEFKIKDDFKNKKEEESLWKKIVKLFKKKENI